MPVDMQVVEPANNAPESYDDFNTMATFAWFCESLQRATQVQGMALLIVAAILTVASTIRGCARDICHEVEGLSNAIKEEE